MSHGSRKKETPTSWEFIFHILLTDSERMNGKFENAKKKKINLFERTFNHFTVAVFLPGESQGWGSLVGCRLWGRTESDTTEAT